MFILRHNTNAFSDSYGLTDRAFPNIKRFKTRKLREEIYFYVRLTSPIIHDYNLIE